jgi:acyl-CoA reductase-like NAD-dependent aldehyde dehydrogenase
MGCSPESVHYYTVSVAATMTERKLLVGGEWIETGDWIDVRSPYSGEIVGRVAKAGAEETRRAIDAAEQAMREPLPAHKRAEILVRVAMGLGRRHDEVARLISDEAGKPMKAARVEAKRAMSTYTFAAVEARKLAGEMVPMDAAQAGEGKLAFTLRRPIGVVAAITPFNFPLNLVAHKLAPALAAGCAVVLKPASQTPLSALLLGELEEEAGLPPGWLNVVAGSSAEIGDVLLEDERIKALTFTGSGTVGWSLKERAPRKKVNLELGNATPVIVTADADVDAAAASMAANGFAFAGQSCISVQRVYVERPAYDAFLERFVPRVEALRIGDPADEETDVGPVIDQEAKERILDWIEEARAAGGAEILAGGEEQDGLIRPTVIAGAGPELKVSCEEVFGPVVTVNAVDSLDEAIELANSTRYGLQAGIFTRGLEAAMLAAQELEFGGVVVNEAPTFRSDQMPYGGVKDSGNTREGPAYAVRELTEERLVVVAL